MTSRATKTAARRRRARRYCHGCGIQGSHVPWGPAADWCAECAALRALGPRSYRDRAASGLLGLSGTLPGVGRLPAFTLAGAPNTAATGRPWAHVDVAALRRQATARWPSIFETQEAT